LTATQAVQNRIDDFFAAQALYWDGLYVQRDGRSQKYISRLARTLQVVDELPLERDINALDIGCGAGQAAIALARRYRRVYAVDTVPAMLELTARRAELTGCARTVSVSVADAHELPYEDGRFGLVLALGLLPWLHAMPRGLAEISRVVAPGGFAVVSFENRLRATNLLDPLFNPWLAGVRRPIRRLLAAALGTDHWECRSPGPALHSRPEIASAVRDAGLEMVSIHGVGYGPLTLLNRPLLPDPWMTRLDAALQGLADSRLKVLQGLAVQYLAVARRPLRAQP
jgi:ubiquinone/menaquinone biosynthesis C-methylase UbiE